MRFKFIPRKYRYKKQFKGKKFNKIYDCSNRFSPLKFGSIGLKVLSCNWMASRQLEAIRQSLKKIVKKSGKIIIHPFPNKAISKKPLCARMGKGKGNVSKWVYRIKPGFIFCEIITENLVSSSKALNLIKKKLSIRTCIIL